MSCELPRCYLAAPTTCPVALRARIRRCRAAPLPPEHDGGKDADHRYGHSSIVRADGVLARRRDQTRTTGRTRRDKLIAFAKTLSIEDEVVLEATGNTAAVERILTALRRAGGRGQFADGSRHRLRPSKDRQDRRCHIGRTPASGFLPEVWIADGETQRQRRQTTERMGVLQQIIAPRDAFTRSYTQT